MKMSWFQRGELLEFHRDLQKLHKKNNNNSEITLKDEPPHRASAQSDRPKKKKKLEVKINK